MSFNAIVARTVQVRPSSEVMIFEPTATNNPSANTTASAVSYARGAEQFRQGNCPVVQVSPLSVDLRILFAVSLPASIPALTATKMPFPKDTSFQLASFTGIPVVGEDAPVHDLPSSEY